MALGALQGALFAGAFTDRRIDVLGARCSSASGWRSAAACCATSCSANRPMVIYPQPWYVLVAAVTALAGLSLQRLFARLDPVHPRR